MPIHKRKYDRKKICVISCVNDELAYSEMKQSFQKLKVPKGMTYEFKAMVGKSNIFEGYQEAMLSSDAKYKIYVHQDVEFADENFLINLITSFRKNPRCGIMGVVGAVAYDTSAVWWESPYLTGAIKDGDPKNLGERYYFEDKPQNQEVLGADGLLLATQYDVDWRTDLFNGWHFYDLSQCIEFRRAGMIAAVLGQAKTAVIHKCGRPSIKGYDESRMIFIEEYKKDITEVEKIVKEMPLASVVIVADDDPEKVALSVESVLAQTTPYLEIIISYAGKNPAVIKLIKNYVDKYEHIKTKENIDTKYVSFLLAGDILLPECMFKLSKYAGAYPYISTVVSEAMVLNNNLDVIGGARRDWFPKLCMFDKYTFEHNNRANKSKFSFYPSGILIKRRFMPKKFNIADTHKIDFVTKFKQMCEEIFDGSRFIYSNEPLVGISVKEK